MKQLIIDINDDGQTLIKFLNKYMNKAPNSLLYKWIRTKKIKINRKRCEPSTILNIDDVVDIFIYDEEINKWKEDKKNYKSDIKLDIAYQNKDIIIVDKPENILVHAATKKDYGNNVVDFIIDVLIEKKEYIPRLEKTFRPAIVNRLDRNTKGLVIGVKNRETLVKLNSQIETENVKKYYLAIVEGQFKHRKVVENILKKDENNFVHVIKNEEENSKLSKTIFNPIKIKEKYSLIEIELITGRTHQIRTTLSNLGYPILGDRRYNNNKNTKFKHQQLVAYKLVFGENIDIDSLKNLTVESKYKKEIINIFERLE